MYWIISRKPSTSKLYSNYVWAETNVFKLFRNNTFKETDNLKNTNFCVPAITWLFSQKRQKMSAQVFSYRHLSLRQASLTGISPLSTES